MAVSDDLDVPALVDALPGRPIRSYPALVATEADALAWARDGGPTGALVVADFQLSARRKGGWPWPVEAGRGLGFSLLIAPRERADRQGWPYVAATTAVADVLGSQHAVAWPDEVRGDGRCSAAVVVQDDASTPARWAVLTVLVAEAEPPRAPLLARLVGAVEHRLSQDPYDLLAEYRPRCVTLGRRVVVRLVPLGPASPTIEGVAVDCRPDGRLVVETPAVRRAVLAPDDVGLIEDHEPGRPPTS